MRNTEPANNAHPLTTPRRIKLLRWTLFASLLISLGVNGYAFYQSYPGAWARADLRIYLTAAEMVHSGAGHQLYDLNAQFHAQQQIYWQAPPRLDMVLPYNHPAFEALPYMLLRPLGPQRAFDLQAIFKTLLMMFAIWLLARRLPHFRAFSLLPAVLWVPAFYPSLGAILNGQDSSELLLLLVLSFLCVRRTRWFMAGMLIGLCVFKYQLAVPMFVLMLVSSRQWRFAAGFFTTSLSAALVSVAITGWGGVGAYVQLTHDLQYFRPWLFTASSMPNLRGLIAANLVGIIANDPLFLLVVGLSAMLFLVAAIFCWKFRAANAAEANLLFAFQLAATILVSYHFYPYDFAIFLPAILLALDHIADNGMDSRPQWWMAAVALLICFVPLHVAALLLRHYDLFALVVLAFFAAVALELTARHEAFAAQSA